MSRKNQVTLPVEALREARISAGDELRVSVDGAGRLILTPVVDPLEELIGSAPGLTALTDLDGVRSEWEQ